MVPRRLVRPAVLLAAAAAASSMMGVSTTATTAATLPPIHHVFVIVLENESSSATFGNPTADPYLAGTLKGQGAYLPNYYGIGHESNDNYIAMVSGQAPNPENQADCQFYDQFVGTGPLITGTGTPLDGQAPGAGCVFPTSVPDLATQLVHSGDTWKGYMEDMGNVPGRESAQCGHPTLGRQDMTQSAVAGDGYVSRHDPFVYFQSIIGDPTYCAAHVVPLGSPSLNATSGLVADLRNTKSAPTPNLSFIVPDVCDDGHDYPCTNETIGSSALDDIDTFLSTWVPRIESSSAYQNNGLIVITFDEAVGPPNGDSSSCCNEMPGPNSPLPGINGMGGGKVGAVLLSPFIKCGTVSTTAYNHYALLGSIEQLFGVARLGFAADVPNTFGSDIYTNFPKSSKGTANSCSVS